MPNSLIQFALSAGVLSPELIARADLEKFDLGLRKGHNWFIDYRGGATIRPPLQYAAGTSSTVGQNVRIEVFQFNKLAGNAYLMVFEHETLRFMRNARYVVDSSEEATVTSITNANPAVVTTSGSHGYSNGDLVYLVTGQSWLDNVPFVVANATATTFELNIVGTTERLDFSGEAGSFSGTVELVYTLSTPYQQEDLFDLDFDQYRDSVYITSTSYEIRKLARFAEDNWTLAPPQFTAPIDSPATITVANGKATLGGAVWNPDGATLDAALLYSVTAVDAAGIESPMSTVAYATGLINITAWRGFIDISWSPVAGAVSYKIYRSRLVPKQHTLTLGEQLGYLGQTVGTSFTDSNIIPDFTQAPPVEDNPFANGAVTSITMTNEGTGYDKSGNTFNFSVGDGNFKGLVIVNPEGKVVGGKILSPGSGYSGATFTITIPAAAGSGATGTVTTSPVSGNNPKASARMQQRRVYAGTVNLPMSLFWSQINQEDSYRFSEQSLISDAFDLNVDSSQLTPIYALVKMDLGLLVFTQSEVLIVRGADDAVLTTSTARNDVVASTGSINLKPLKVGDSCLYVTEGASGVTAIRPTQVRTSFSLKDTTLLSTHYFTPRNPIVAWTVSHSPKSIVWAVRADGSLLSMTYVPDQNIEAWTDHSTDGLVKDVCVLHEDSEDRLYLVVERNGRVNIERMASFYSNADADLFAVDGYVPSPLATSTDAITLSAARGTGITVAGLAGGAIFSSVAVGDAIKVGEGLLVVTAKNGADTELTVNAVYPVRELNQQTGAPKASYATWEKISAVTSVKGLWHLEGQSVSAIFADAYEDDLTVAGGGVTLTAASPTIAVGKAYTGDLVTLPLSLAQTIIEDKKKNIKDISVRLRGPESVSVTTLTDGQFFDCSCAGYDDFALAQYIDTKIVEVSVGASWETDDSIVLRNTRPFRASVLGFVIGTNIGK